MWHNIEVDYHKDFAYIFIYACIIDVCPNAFYISICTINVDGVLKLKINKNITMLLKINNP
jgi:hypothetical protein